jgi:hypothetical protein
MKNPVLSLFDKIHLKEECILTQLWITDSNIHHFMKISLQGLQEAPCNIWFTIGLDPRQVVTQ